MRCFHKAITLSLLTRSLTGIEIVIAIEIENHVDERGVLCSHLNDSPITISISIPNSIKKRELSWSLVSSLDGVVQGLVHIRFEIVHMLQPDTQADIIRGYAGGGLLGPGQLLVGGGGRVDDQGLGVADVG